MLRQVLCRTGGGVLRSAHLRRGLLAEAKTSTICFETLRNTPVFYHLTLRCPTVGESLSHGCTWQTLLWRSAARFWRAAPTVPSVPGSATGSVSLSTPSPPRGLALPSLRFFAGAIFASKRFHLLSRRDHGQRHRSGGYTGLQRSASEGVRDVSRSGQGQLSVLASGTLGSICPMLVPRAAGHSHLGTTDCPAQPWRWVRGGSALCV